MIRPSITDLATIEAVQTGCKMQPEAFVKMMGDKRHLTSMSKDNTLLNILNTCNKQVMDDFIKD